MYSTKNIENILLANTTNKKPLLARKIQYLNNNTDGANMFVYVSKSTAPDTLFVFYHDIKTKTNHDITYEIDKFLNKNVSVDFAFNINPKTKTIETHSDRYAYKKGKEYNISDIYTNQEMKKILKDLLKNGIITEKYKLKIDKNKYLVSDILSNKDTPIKYSSRGNPLMYHGTSWGNWESIKKHGGLRPNFSTRKEYGYKEGITNKGIYLTTSFTVAKSYATSYKQPFSTEWEESPVILLVEVPDVDKLMPDDDFIDTQFSRFFHTQIRNRSNTDVKSPDIEEFQKTLIYDEENNPFVKIDGELFFDTMGGHNVARNSAKINDVYVISLDGIFSILRNDLINAVMNNNPNVLDKFIKLSLDWYGKENKNFVDTIVNTFYKLFQIFYKRFGKVLNTTSFINQSLNDNFYSFGVAYRVRIPLSYIHGAFNVKGERVE